MSLMRTRSYKEGHIRYRGVALLLMLLVATPAHAVIPGGGDRLRVCADPYSPPLSTDKEDGFENRIAALLAEELGVPLEYTWFPQRMGFIRNTLRSEVRDGVYKCDLVMSVPSAFELAATTVPYYASTWALVYAVDRGFELGKPEDIDSMTPEQRAKIRAGIFDNGPGQIWAYKHGLMGNARPYISQPGDATVSPAETMLKDIAAGKIDMGFVWGPISGYYVKQYENLALLPLTVRDPLVPEMKFHYNISMGVRHGDREWRTYLDGFITENKERIEAILAEYGVPMVPISRVAGRGDDDD